VTGLDSASAAIVTSTIVLFAAFWTYLLNRARRVMVRRATLISRLASLNSDDFVNNNRARVIARERQFLAITYKQMVWRVWKPVESFYKGCDFWS